MSFVLGNKNRVLDDTDVLIITLLSKNARISVADLARQVGMSAPSVNERIKRLEESGVIAGYRVEIDPVALGYSLMALVRIRHRPGKLQELKTLIEQMPEFVECDKVTGEDCFVARLYMRDISELDPILDRVSEIADTSTAIVKSTPVKRRLPPLE